MRIFIGNLSTEASEDDLRQACEAFGQLESVSIAKEGEESKGFAFVEMANKAEAEALLAGLNGKEIKGQAVKVSEARADKRAGLPRSGGNKGGFQGKGNFNTRGPGSSHTGGSKGGFNMAKGSSSKV